ncbi:MAG: FAD-binding oxidoreductase [Actinomycetota bacterium]|nr:FAD-binding oxidoreductase [Actinomycetota bacterium]
MDPLDSLVPRLPPDRVSRDPAQLAPKARDMSALALLAGVRGDQPVLPAAAVLPRSTEEMATVLAWAQETGTPIVPRGGGSGVSGGGFTSADSVVVDLSRMDRVLGIDTVSRTVEVEAGIGGTVLEAALEAKGLTTGHYPQSIELSTVGGWIAASSAGQASSGYGAIEDLVLGMTVVLAGGAVVRLKPVPRSAAGPDLRRLFIGSEGTLGVVTGAVLACRPRPLGYAWAGFGFDSFEACIEAMRAIEAAGVGSVVVRGYDEADATLAFGRLGHAGGSAAIVGFAADAAGLAERMAEATTRANAAGGRELGPAYGEHWWVHRNDAVGLYRRIMGPDRAFGPGTVVDTMEVAAVWSRIPALYGRVREALLAGAEIVGCHLSHVYPAGSSLYFTFLVRGSDDRDVEGRYLATWEGAVQACLMVGGTITHHHGVGRLKARFMAAELGEEGLAVLRAVKRVLDPSGILNPGVLLP